MDEKELDLNPGDSLPKLDDVFRLVLVSERDRKNKSIPAVRCFSLTPRDENKLSVEWSKKTTPEEAIARFGASYKFNSTVYKFYANREIYALNVNFLHSFSDIDDVIYDPIFIQPPVKGGISNPAHSLIVFTEAFASDQANEPEVLLKIRDHAKDKKVEINWEEVDQLVIELRNGD